MKWKISRNIKQVSIFPGEILTWANVFFCFCGFFCSAGGGEGLRQGNLPTQPSSSHDRKKRRWTTSASVHSAVVVPGDGKLNSLPHPSDGVCKLRSPPWNITSTAAANWPADRGIVGVENTLRSSAENTLMPKRGGQDETRMCTCSTHAARARRRQRPVITPRKQRDRPRKCKLET